MISVEVSGIVRLAADAVTVHQNGDLEPDRLKKLISAGGDDDLVICRVAVLRKLLQETTS